MIESAPHYAAGESCTLLMTVHETIYLLPSDFEIEGEHVQDDTLDTFSRLG
ncbi:predicted protein [Botrytis cinerea T4]|uniref:Uncharacterized protein n=1 Tax=Botryotinia fuckeliana (strain T4) TaxID=999810 RepID=G2Y2R3_BOTF4|nr:predicted protein [Botrytis cinerea T4]